MSKSRMAGDKLRNQQIREEIGNDAERLASRIAGVDREAYNFDGYTDKQINMALQGETFGDKDYERLTGKPVGGDEPEIKEPEATAPIVEEEPTVTTPADPSSFIDPAPTPGPTQGINVGSSFGEGPFSQNVIQDNDITSTVTGNNNTVTNTQDNSVNAYGGDAQRFTNDYIRKFTSRYS